MSEPVYISEIFSSIQGEGLLAGRRQIFVRLAECNLDCRYCDTNINKAGSCKVESRPGSADFVSTAHEFSLDRLVATISGWCSQLPGAHHSVSITGGEPLLYADALADWCAELRKLLPLHLETNGTMHVALERVIRHFEYISMDMKLPSTSGCTEHLWDVHRLFLQKATASKVSVKLVVGESSGEDEIHLACDIISGVAPQTPLFLQPLSLPDGRIGITARRILRLQEVAASKLPDVRVMPQMHRILGAL